MIRGYFLGARRRPYVVGRLHFPPLAGRHMDVRLLVDTGADRTLLGTLDADRFSRGVGVALTSLPEGASSIGIGGQMPTRVIEAVLTLDSFSVSLQLPILEVSPTQLALPSILGRDILARFGLFMEERTSRLFLLEPHEIDAIPIP